MFVSSPLIVIVAFKVTVFQGSPNLPSLVKIGIT